MKLSLTSILNETFSPQDLLRMAEDELKQTNEEGRRRFGVGVKQAQYRIKKMTSPENKKALEKHANKYLADDGYRFKDLQRYGSATDTEDVGKSYLDTFGFISTLVKWSLDNKSQEMEQAHAAHVQQKQEEMRRFQAAMDEDE